jgi:rubrerythrin
MEEMNQNNVRLTDVRMIDANKLLRDIEEYHVSDGKFQHWVQIQQTIEPERKKGEWNTYYRIHSDDTFICNRCNSCFIVVQGEDRMNFCPYCGSDNRG